jgi:hypothetical protein
MAAAEDDGDRRAALGIQAELTAQDREFDENAPAPPRDADDGEGSGEDDEDQPEPAEPAVAVEPATDAVQTHQPAASANVGGVVQVNSDQAPVETDEAKLTAHLAKLRDIDKHVLEVLDAYFAPVHEAQLAEARQAVQAREAQLQQMRERISEQVASIISDDEEQLFYNRDDAFRAYVQRVATQAPPATFGPPVPDEKPSVYIDPGHLTLYRVGFVAFIPIFKRKGDGEIPKLKIPRPVAMPQKGSFDVIPREVLAPVTDNIPLPCASRVSLFRRKEELKPGIRFGYLYIFIIAVQFLTF